LAPVPEAPTMVAAVLLLLPFGMCVMRIIRSRPVPHDRSGDPEHGNI
jgi:hypothetical protein